MDLPKLLTSQEVGALLRKDPTTVTRRCRTEWYKVGAFQDGRGWRIPEALVLALINPPRGEVT